MSEGTFRVGQAWRMTFGTPPQYTELRHIRAVVDDCYIVYKVWSGRRQSWDYRVEWDYAWNLAITDGRLERVPERDLA